MRFLKKCNFEHFFYFFILTNYAFFLHLDKLCDFFFILTEYDFFLILPLWALLWQIDLALFVVSEICLFWGFRLSWVQRRPLCLTAIREDRFFQNGGFWKKTGFGPPNFLRLPCYWVHDLFLLWKCVPCPSPTVYPKRISKKWKLHIW